MGKKQRIPSSTLKPYAETAFTGNWPKGYEAYLKDEATGICYMLPYGKWVIGRKDEEETDIDIPVTTTPKFMPYMSHRHAILTLKRNLIGENALYIRDFKGTTNHTYVDRQPLADSFDYQLFDKDVVRMGLTLFTAHLRL
ncbi:MAG TPA: FHA domain-containing protein [Candidatus Phocaeicola caecigallinarum]|nr:FHA domain-containing protein [Candidatus Phocaeicola caecigallinarum]